MSTGRCDFCKESDHVLACADRCDCDLPVKMVERLADGTDWVWQYHPECLEKLVLVAARTGGQL